MQNRAYVKGMVSLATGFESVATKTRTITCPSALFSLPLHCVTSLYGLLNWVKPGYAGIITESWLIWSILECYSRKDVTKSTECFTTPWWKVWWISGTIIIIGEMHFISLMTQSEVLTTWSSRYSLAICLFIPSPWVTSIVFWKYSR